MSIIPKHVTSKDIDGENKLLGILQNAGAIKSWQKLNEKDDFAHIDAQAVTMSNRSILLEIKNRNKYSLESMTGMGGPWFNCYKMWTAIHMARIREMPLYFSTLYACGIVALYDLYDPLTGNYSLRCAATPEISSGAPRPNQEMSDRCFAIKLGEPKHTYSDR